MLRVISSHGGEGWSPKVSEEGRGFVSGTVFRAQQPILHGLPDPALPSRPGSVPAEHHMPVTLCQSSGLLCPLPLPTCPFLKNPPRSPGAAKSLLLTPATGSPLFPSLFYSCSPSLGRLCIPAPLVFCWDEGLRGKAWLKGGSCLPLGKQNSP